MSPKVLDAEGREIRVGDRVQTPYGSGTLDRVLNANGPGNPILRVARDKAHPLRFSTRPALLTRFTCPDLLLADQPTKEGSRHG